MNEPQESRRKKPNDLLYLCRHVTNGSPLAMLAVEGLTHIVRYANPAFCLLAGKEPRELIGNPFVEAVPEGAENECLALLDRVYRTGQTQTLADQKHFQSLSSPVYWSYTAWAIREESEAPIGVMVQVTDTTEATLFRRQSERVSEEVKEINQELLIASIREQELAVAAAAAEQELHQAQKMESIGRLAGGIAHDFNNLLTAILGFTELAGETLQQNDEVQVYLHNIHKAADRAAALTAQLLAFARKQIIAPKIVDLNALILEVDTMLSRLIGEHIELFVVPAPDAGQVKIDPGQFGQVLINLVVNARDAMPDGGKITIKTAKATREDADLWPPEAAPGDYALLSISDTGTGISEEMQAHLFEPFFTTKGQGKGTGLGLATCYGIVAQSGGHIQVESELGKGTTFAIYLPRIEEEAISLLEPGAASPFLQGTEVIFLVEDEPMVRYIGANALRHQGYTVLEAENGRAALHLLQEYTGKIDLLVTDVVMPQMGGRELADRLCAVRPDVRVLFISGYTDDAIVHQGVLDPGLAFLQKPFTPAALAKKVREVLDEADEDERE